MSADLGSLRIDKSLKQEGAASGANRPARAGWVVALVVLLGAGILGYMVSARRGAEMPVVQVTRVANPTANDAGSTGEVVLNATGYIVAAHKIELAPKVVGRVLWVGVEMGDKVEEGQVIVRLEDDEYKARLLQVKGQLDGAKARLAELQAGNRPEEVARARAEYAQFDADLLNARNNVERTRKLAGTNAVSEQAVDDAEAKFRVADARASAAKAALDLALAGPRKEQIDAQRAQVEQYQGAYDQVRVDFDNTIIKAPLTGTILARNVEVGEYVTTGFVSDGGAKGFVVSLADLADLRVELDISQSDFPKVALGQACTVVTDAYPDRKYAGVVDLISPEANRQKATILTKVKILDPDEYLRPDMNASVSFHPPKSDKKASEPGDTNQSTDDAPPRQQSSVTVPASAVKDGKVFVIGADNTAVERPVEVGSASSAGVRIVSGLVGGESVIVSPPASLRSGDVVNIQELVR